MRRLAYIHHLGNLTMLPPKVNSTLQDKSPDVKAATYRSCGLIATREVGEAIENGTKWNEAAVRERASRIETFVRKEWAD
ncbi:DUF1524 domain-containing protein [Oceanicella sp. SM1341]|uniref:GmrSD restriction endonuclease domain-containing protein n=1 Tax=Oceanicella sp. SM1341 TaxID=1548889 RepID=UPI003514F6F4